MIALFFRDLTFQYAMALSLPNPLDKGALAELIATIAQQDYGLQVTAEQVLELLKEGIDLCKGDFKGNIKEAIQGIIENK